MRSQVNQVVPMTKEEKKAKILEFLSRHDRINPDVFRTVQPEPSLHQGESGMVTDISSWARRLLASDEGRASFRTEIDVPVEVCLAQTSWLTSGPNIIESVPEVIRILDCRPAPLWVLLAFMKQYPEYLRPQECCVAPHNLLFSPLHMLGARENIWQGKKILRLDVLPQTDFINPRQYLWLFAL